MKIFGFEITWRRKQTGPFQTVDSGASWFSLIRESFTGAWQMNVTVDGPKSILAFSAVFACVTTIAGDIGKLRIKLLRYDEANDIWPEAKPESTLSPFLRVLKKPNHYQTLGQFIAQWIISKLLWGNTYVLKVRERARGMVTALYVLDATRVTPLVTPSGDVYYRLMRDDLSGVTQEEDGLTVPASEIIHDRMNCLWHPLVGVSPIYACGVSATMGNKIQANSTNLFANAARPSGMLTAPGDISTETAERLKAAWETNYSGTNIGKIAVAGNGLEFKPFVMSSVDAQLIEQLKWTVEDVARAFHMPLFKIGGPLPTYANNIEALQTIYYTDCLQQLMEDFEATLDEGMELPPETGVELDLDNLLRMDSTARYDRHNKAIAGGWFEPNKARQIENLPKAKGGDSPMMQQQNWTLEQLAERPAPVDKPSVAPPPPAPPVEPAPGGKAANDDTAALVFIELAEAAHG